MNNRFLKNTAWIMGGKIIQNLIGFIVNILTASYLGPSNFGIIGYVASIITLFTALSNLGLGNIIVKEIIANKNEEGVVVGTAITMQTISSFIAYIMVVITVIATNTNDKVMWVCAFLQSLSLIFAVSDNVFYYYQSRLESKVTIIITVSAYIIAQIYKVILLVLNKSVEWFAFANSLEILLVAIAVFTFYFAKKSPKLKFSIDIAKKLLKQSSPFILAGTVSVIYASLDKIMLKEMLGGTEAVGYYNVAHTISNSWIFLLSAIITSFSPLVYEALHTEGVDSKLYKERLHQMYFLVFWLGVLASIFIDIIAPWLIKWAYNGAYDLSIKPAMILTWASIFSYMGVARGIQFVCENKQKYVIIFAILTVILNIICNLLLIPKMQIMGAAIATCISEIFVCVIAPLILKKTRNVSVDILESMIGKGVHIKEIVKNIFNRFNRNKKIGLDTKVKEKQKRKIKKVEKIELENIENTIKDINQKSELNTDENKINNIENLDNKDKAENKNKEGIIDNNLHIKN